MIRPMAGLSLSEQDSEEAILAFKVGFSVLKQRCLGEPGITNRFCGVSLPSSLPWLLPKFGRGRGSVSDKIWTSSKTEPPLEICLMAQRVKIMKKVKELLDPVALLGFISVRTEERFYPKS